MNQTREATDTKPGVPRHKILIVDDLEANLFTLNQVLKAVAADVIQAQSGQAALAAVLEHDFDLIILDVQMPGMDGYELAEFLRGNDTSKHIPIIFVTAGQPDEKQLFRGYEAGAIDYMIKPYAPTILLCKARILLEMADTKKEILSYQNKLEQLVVKRTVELTAAHEELLQFSWLLDKEQGIVEHPVEPGYKDVTALNRDGRILTAVGANTLEKISRDVMELLDTSLAIYEKNGAYALGTFVSGWCGTLNKTSHALCETADLPQAQNCGKWLCHDSCWKISKAAIDAGEPVDEACCGGIRIYALPIYSGKEIIGAINFGYGTPPQTAEEQAALASEFQVDVDEIRYRAEAYKPRPPFIINVAKRRLQFMANLIGEIVERKQVEAALRESEMRYDQLASQNRTITWEVDATGLFTYCSHVAQDIWGYSLDEIIGKKHFYDLHPEEERESYKSAAFGVFVRKELFQGFENPVVTKEGRIVWMSTTGIPLLDEQGELIGYRGSDTDITERKQAEETLKERNRELERYNKMTIGRELRMIDLKKEVNALARELNRSEPYAESS